MSQDCVPIRPGLDEFIHHLLFLTWIFEYFLFLSGYWLHFSFFTLRWKEQKSVQGFHSVIRVKGLLQSQFKASDFR